MDYIKVCNCMFYLFYIAFNTCPIFIYVLWVKWMHYNGKLVMIDHGSKIILKLLKSTMFPHGWREYIALLDIPNHPSTKLSQRKGQNIDSVDFSVFNTIRCCTKITYFQIFFKEWMRCVCIECLILKHPSTHICRCYKKKLSLQ